MQWCVLPRKVDVNARKGQRRYAPVQEGDLRRLGLPHPGYLPRAQQAPLPAQQADELAPAVCSVEFGLSLL